MVIVLTFLLAGHEGLDPNEVVSPEDLSIVDVLVLGIEEKAIVIVFRFELLGTFAFVLDLSSESAP